MGKASRWFRAIFGGGGKKASDSSSSSPAKEKKKWGFARGSSYAESSSYGEAVDANKHAIAVAAATAAVAEAALAAAHAAAEVVRLTSGGSGSSSRPNTAAYDRGRRELAAVKIQSAFRAYLARRALRALKGLVRLQALVRGHIVRKQSADMLRRMQAMARIQARACSNRAHVSESSQSSSKSSNSCHPDLATPKKYGKQFRAYSTKSDWSPMQKVENREFASRNQSSQSYMKIKGNIDLERIHIGSNWLDRWMEEHPWNSQGDTSQKSGQAEDERSDKILEVDTWKPHPISKQGNKVFGAPFDPLPRHPTKPQKQNPSTSSGEVSSLTSLKFPTEVDQGALWARENSPQMYSASSRLGSSGRRGPFTPARSECSKSLFGDYMGYPNYMANTESSWAKVRSQSAPRQRIMQVEKPGSLKRFVRGYWDGDSISERGLDMCEDFSTKAYPGSEMPMRGNSTTEYKSSYGGR
ncbi:hypothetical protein C3L33_03190, partial [Rhododendron williamsianum]